MELFIYFKLPQVARAKHLKPDGTMFPSHAKIFVAPCALTDFIEANVKFWESVSKFHSCFSSIFCFYMNRTFVRDKIRAKQALWQNSRKEESKEFLEFSLFTISCNYTIY